ncbi:MAG: HYR domain-containing protein, partial [Saprospiraceae bacterium]|nr:HYR domain-containing protein [Saprospiraceae bacterium]
METHSLPVVRLFFLFTLFTLSLSAVGLAQMESQYASNWSDPSGVNWTPAAPSSNVLGPPNSSCVGTSNSGLIEAYFTFPAFSTTDPIVGIEFNVNYGCVINCTMQLTNGGTLIGNTRVLPSTPPAGSCNASQVRTSGGPMDLWGATISATALNSGNIGVRLSRMTGLDNPVSMDIESVQMVVYFGSANSDPDCSGASISDRIANASCQATISGSDVTGVTDPDMDPLTITVSPTTLNLGSNSVTVTAMDGNDGSCMTTINVNVVDETDPVITCPMNQIRDNAPGFCGSVVNYPAPTVSDNCDNSPVVVCSPPSGSFFPVGTTTVTCTATDDAGNMDECTFTVTVNDSELPSITCPSGFTVECIDAIPACNALEAVVSDNCPGVLTPTCSEGPLVGTACNGTITRTFTVFDAAGNMNTCQQLITIIAPLPVWNTPPGDLFLPCNVLPQTSLLGWTRGTGACQTTGQVLSTIVGTVGLCEGYVTEEWEYTDPCGVTINHDRRVYYKIDTEAPELIGVPKDIFVPCGSALPSWPVVTANDNCDGLVPVSRHQTQAGTKCGTVFYERIWTTVDECGNSSQQKQTIRFLDEKAPTLEVPKDTVLKCGNPIPEPIYHADDECSWLDVKYSEKRTNHNACEYTLVRTWTATDGCGNAVQKTQTIEVIDPDAPVITVINPMLKNLSLGAKMEIYSCESPRVENSDIVVKDCCTDISIEAYDQLLTIGNCAENGYLQKWKCGYNVSDGAGNKSEFYFFVYLRDSTAPAIFNVPSDTTLACSDTIPDLPSGEVYSYDECTGIDTPEVSESYYYDPLDSNQFALARTWYISDACGNMARDSQWILTCDFDTILLNPDTLTTVDTGLVQVNPVSIGQSQVDNSGSGSARGSLIVYPNPTAHYVTLSIDLVKPEKLKIGLYDKLGRRLKYVQAN